VSRSTLQRLEAGRTPDPSLRVLVNLALVLGVPLQDIVEDEWLEGRSLDGSRHRPRGVARWDEAPTD
jgi:transcriptional regulator with XRE-family HTH domain